MHYQFSLEELTAGGAHGDSRDRRGPYKLLAMSPAITPSPLIFSLIEGSGGGITSRIAVQITQAAIAERCQDFYQEYSQPHERQRAAVGDAAESGGLAAAIVREVFKEANSRVYQYALRMAASGTVAARGFICAYDGKRFCAAKVGDYQGYIWRGGAIEPLYVPKDRRSESGEGGAGTMQRFIGANAQILVDVVSVSMQDGDVVLVSNCDGGPEFAGRAAEILRQMDSLEETAAELAVSLFETALAADERRRDIVLGVLRAGRPLIRLTHVLNEA